MDSISLISYRIASRELDWSYHSYHVDIIIVSRYYCIPVRHEAVNSTIERGPVKSMRVECWPGWWMIWLWKTLGLGPGAFKHFALCLFSMPCVNHRQDYFLGTAETMYFIYPKPLHTAHSVSPSLMLSSALVSSSPAAAPCSELFSDRCAPEPRPVIGPWCRASRALIGPPRRTARPRPPPYLDLGILQTPDIVHAN